MADITPSQNTAGGAVLTPRKEPMRSFFDFFGAKSVSLSTTSAVVISCVMILIADYVVTSFIV
jgi:hypothetical protein